MISDTLIITIIIVVVVVVLALLLVSYMFWSRSKRNPVPLPPVQPLARDRERGLLAFAEDKAREKALYMQVAPSWSDLRSTAGSTESSSTAYPPAPPGISPVKRYPQSLASSAHSSHLSSGIPHGPNSTVQIVLPTPLASFALDNSRYSVADEWASQVIYNDQPARSRSSRSLSKPHSRSQRQIQSPSISAQSRSRVNSLSYPTIASYAPPLPTNSYPVDPSPPPVPPIPSIYNEFKYAPRVLEKPRRRSRSRGPAQDQPDEQSQMDGHTVSNASVNPPRRSRSHGPAISSQSQLAPEVPINGQEKSRSRDAPSHWSSEPAVVPKTEGHSGEVPAQNLDWVSEALVTDSSRTRQSSHLYE